MIIFLVMQIALGRLAVELLPEQYRESVLAALSEGGSNGD